MERRSCPVAHGGVEYAASLNPTPPSETARVAGSAIRHGMLGEADQWARAHFLFGQTAVSRWSLVVSENQNTMNVEEQVRQIAERVAASYGVEVWDIEFRGGGGKSRMLRIYIDKAAGVTHEDCELVSREVSTILDMEDVVPGSGYLLEVSSPGLDRKLRGPRDYERFQGSLVKLQTLEPVNGSRNYEGRLTNFADGKLTLEMPPKGKGSKQVPGAAIEIELGNVAKANLVPEF
jgi:ribosome maturation factor RimP